MNKITNIIDHGNLWYIETTQDLYKVAYSHCGGYDVFRASYHTHRNGKVISNKTTQRPRWKLIGNIPDRPMFCVGDDFSF